MEAVSGVGVSRKSRYAKKRVRQTGIGLRGFRLPWDSERVGSECQPYAVADNGSRIGVGLFRECRYAKGRVRQAGIGPRGFRLPWDWERVGSECPPYAVADNGSLIRFGVFRECRYANTGFRRAGTRCPRGWPHSDGLWAGVCFQAAPRRRGSLNVKSARAANIATPASPVPPAQPA